jgi:hypothetical protein
MDVPASKIVRLLDPDRPAEVRRAAAVVLGELGVRDADVARTLCEHLGDADGSLRLEVIRAVGKLRVDAALPRLLERIRDGGTEAEEAARAAARLGARGHRGLQELMPRVAPGLRRYIAAALAAAGGDGAGVGVLLDHDPGVVEAAARSLMAQLPTLPAAPRKHLIEHLLELASDRKNPLPPASALAVVRLLGATEDPRVADALWDRVGPSNPAEVRVAALQGLGRWAEAPGKEQLKRLFACAAEADFRVAAPALVILNRLTATDRSLSEWLALLEAPDIAVRRMAMDKIGDRDRPEVAAALMRQMDHPDRGLREAALVRLARLGRGREALTEALLEASSPDRAWQLARAQAAFVKDYPEKWRDKIYAHACRHLEAGDRLADPLLFLLREADPADLHARLEATALTLRKKKAYEKALLYLRLLARDPALGFDTRLELAACGLKVSPRDLSAEARASDAALHQFSHLGQQEDENLVAQLEKTKWLDPEELYYLGFHLAEQDARLRKVATKVLQMVVNRSPRGKTAQAAKSKLHSAALD